jgi:hypothetical protein
MTCVLKQAVTSWGKGQYYYSAVNQPVTKLYRGKAVISSYCKLTDIFVLSYYPVSIRKE